MGVVQQQMAALRKQATDGEDQQESPETPGEAPDPEDQAEGPEGSAPGADPADAEDASEGPETPGEAPDAEDQSEGDEGGEDGSNVSPEEQAQYDTVVIAAEAMLYGKGTSEAVVARIKQSKGDPADLGHLVAMILMSIAGGAQKEGKDIPGDILFAAGKEVVADVLEIAEAAGVIPKEKEADFFKLIAFNALKVYGSHELAQGQVGPQQRAQAAQSLQRLKAEHGKKKLIDLAKGGA